MDFDFFELFESSATDDSAIASESIADSAYIVGVDQEAFLQDGQDDPFASDEHSLCASDVIVHDAAMADMSESHFFDNGVEDMFSVESSDNSYLSADTNASLVDDVLGPVYRIFDDIYYFFFGGCDDIVTQNHFSSDGSIDLKNNVLVEGNVAHDIQYTEQQTHGSCSLMAQEQFVHRYTGQAIPEDYLEWTAQKWGVYSPDLGTDVNGQTMVLEHFNIPHERFFDKDIIDLNNAVSENKDIIIGVDAREFYGDTSCPPGSGHAVAIVGRGINPETHELEGFYVTDSNFPQSAHFVSVERMQNSWHGDMITIPEKSVA